MPDNCKPVATRESDIVADMKVWVLWNDEAGRSMGDGVLGALIERAGHVVVDVVSKDEPGILEVPAGVDLVAVAGGDGTVATAAALLAGTAIPLAILPLGTANNIATSLGLCLPIEVLARSWTTASRTPFDLGSLHGRSEPRLVVEGLGGGWVPAGIAALKRAESAQQNAEGTPPAEKVDHAASRFSDVLERLEPEPWTLVADGETWSGELIAFEVLNIPLIGPNLALADAADPGDGYFDLLMARPGDREALRAFMARRLEGQDAVHGLPVRRVREVQIEGRGALHIDDEQADAGQLGRLTLTVSEGQLTVLR